MAENDDNGGLPTGGEPQGVEPKADDTGWFKHRLARELEKHEKRIYSKIRENVLAELGVEGDDIESLKALSAEKAKKSDEVSRLSSEMQKLKKVYEREAEEKKTLMQQLEALSYEKKSRMINDAIMQQLDGKGVRSPSQVVKLLSSEFQVDEDGIHHTSGKKSVAEVVQEFLKTNDHFLPATAQQGAGSKPGSGESKDEDRKKLLLTREGRRDLFTKWLEDTNKRN